MEDRLRAAIPRIEIVQNGQVVGRGSGCLIAADVVLTAYHVIGDRRANPPAPYPGDIRLTFPGGQSNATLVDGCWDPRADWALLRLQTPIGVKPIPMGDVAGSGLPWETFGYPDANPEGMVQTGTLENDRAELDGSPVFQLFSKQAAAGNGAPVRGLSGGPLIVENAVVGLMRFALMKDGLTVAGTIYACPVSSIMEKTAELLPIPDPCRGLPGLPRRPLPSQPFKYLDRYSENEAEVFFGRDAHIKTIFERLTSPDAEPVTLLYGQSGVGKSSILDAGVTPRLRWNYEVRYVRRKAEETLAVTLLRAIVPSERTLTVESRRLLSLWTQFEQNTGRPLIVIFDQIEEVFTQGDSRTAGELAELAALIHDVFFEDPERAPKGRILLSFRKEWLPEVQRQMEDKAVHYGRVFLERLNESGVKQVINGLTRTRRLRAQYNLEVSPGLPEELAANLLSDPSSPVAPTLQILLTKLWGKATEGGEDNPKFTSQLYRQMVREGAMLGDFLDQQMEKLKQRLPDVVASGFALELMRAHTTGAMTSGERRLSDLQETYPAQASMLAGYLEHFKSLALLVGTSETMTRLSHDTLAPIVRDRCANSLTPGLRGMRIVEGRAAEWQHGSGETMSSGELAIVESGLKSMRALKPHEEEMLKASRLAEKRRRKRDLLMGAVPWGIGLVATVSAAILVVSMRMTDEAKEQIGLREKAAAAIGSYETDPVAGLVMAVADVARNLEIQPTVLPQVQRALQLGVETALETNRWSMDSGCKSLAAAGDRIVSVSTTGMVEIRGEDGRKIKDWRPNSPATVAEFSPDGQLLAIGHEKGGGVALYTREGESSAGISRVLGDPSEAIQAIAFTPDGGTVASVNLKGDLVMASLDGKSSKKVEIGEYGQAALVSATGSSGRTALFCLTPQGQIRRWNKSGPAADDWMEDSFQGAKNKPFFTGGALIKAIAATTAQGKLRIATGDASGNVQTWDDDGNPEGSPYVVPDKPIASVAFDRRGKTIVSTSGNEVHLSDEAGVPLSHYAAFLKDVTDARFVRGGRVVAGSADRTIRFLDVGNKGPQQSGWEDSATAVAMRSGDDPAVISGDREGRLWFRSLREGTHALLLSGSPIISIAIQPVDKSLWVATEDSKIYQVDKTVSRVIHEIAVPNGSITALRLTREHAITGNENGTVQLWDLKGNPIRDLYQFPTPERDGTRPPRVVAVHFSPRDDGFVSVAADGSVAAGSIPRRLQMKPILEEFPGEKVHEVASDAVFTSKGNAIIISTQKGHLIRRPLYRGVDTAEPLHLKAHSGEILAMAIRGDTVYTAGADSRIGINNDSLDMAGSSAFAGHRNRVEHIEVSQDGPFAISSSLDGSIRLWNLDWKEWLKVACDRLQTHQIMHLKQLQTGDKEKDLDVRLQYGVNNEDIESARKFCQQRVWSTN